METQTQPTTENPKETILSLIQVERDESKLQTLLQGKVGVIRNEAERVLTAERVAELRTFIKEFEDTANKPINMLKDISNVLKANRDKYLLPLKTRLEAYKDKLVAYKEKTDIKIEASKAKEITDYNRNVEKAEKRGEDPRKVPLPTMKYGPSNSVRTPSGTVGFASITHVMIVGHPEINSDEKPELFANNPLVKNIPLEFFELNWPKVRAAIQQDRLPACFQKYEKNVVR